MRSGPVPPSSHGSPAALLLQERAAEADRMRLPLLIGVGVGGETEHSQALAGHRAEQVLNHQLRSPVLLRGVESHPALPAVRHFRQVVMAAEVYQIEDVLLETAAASTRAGIAELRSDPAVGSDRPRHLPHLLRWPHTAPPKN